MKGLRRAILIASLLSGVLIGLGVLVAVDPGLFGISTACPACILPIWLIYPVFIAGAGSLIGLVALVLAVVDAARRRDRPSVWLIVLLFCLSYGASAYLGAAVAATSGPGGRSTGAPSLALVLILTGACVLTAPVTALLYALLRDQPTPRLAILSGLAILLVIAPLVVAPPWIVFSRANGAPVLSASAPHVTVNCTQGQYPPITLKNTGAGTLRWTSFAAFNAVTINPSSGSLGPGAAQTVTLTGAYTPSADRPQEVGVEFDSNGGSVRVTYACQSATGATPSP
jgi:hypothetical protein